MKATIPYHDTVDRFRRALLTEVLQFTNGNRTKAARVLGLQRTYLVRLIGKFGVNVPHRDRK